jgi:hypothetical protein
MRSSTVYLVTSPLVYHDIVLPGMIEPIEICDLCPERARIFGVRVEGEAIDTETQDLISIFQ